jgi:hypothetical protein
VNEQQLRAILTRNPAITTNDPAGRQVRDPEPKRDPAAALEPVAERKTQSVRRIGVRFTGFRVRLLDSDNYERSVGRLTILWAYTRGRPAKDYARYGSDQSQNPKRRTHRNRDYLSEMKTELPDDIKRLVEERTELESELGGLRMVNTYGQKLDFLIEMNCREIGILRRIEEVKSRIDAYIRAGRNL